MKILNTHMLILGFCIFAVVIGSIVGVQNRLTAAVFVYGTLVVVVDLWYLDMRRHLIPKSETMKSNVLLLPFWTFLLYSYVFAIPWMRLPLAFESFMHVAPDDSRTGLFMRFATCAISWIVATDWAKKIIWGSIGQAKKD